MEVPYSTLPVIITSYPLSSNFFTDSVCHATVPLGNESVTSDAEHVTQYTEEWAIDCDDATGT